MSSTVYTPFKEEDLLPKEERLEVVKKNQQLFIGIPKETCLNEKRLCLTPDAVQVLTQNGHQVIMETGAGEGCFFTDLQYSEAGATITDDSKIALGQQLVLKVNPPTLDEIPYLKNGAFLISALQVNLRDVEYFQALAHKKISAIAFEFVKDEYQQLALVRLIGEIAGNVSILYAAELLAKSNGLMLGGITGVRPAEVVIIGAGILGEFAAKTAIGLGAHVKVFDNSLAKLRRLHNFIDNRVSTSIIDPKELGKSLRRADVLIGALQRRNFPPVVTEEMITKMKAGSVAIDLTIDYGKSIETAELTTINDPVIFKHGVVHSGIPNITSKTPRTTTKAISNFFLSYLLDAEHDGGLETMLLKNTNMKDCFYTYKGKFTKKMVCERFNLPYHDINLLTY